MDIDLFQVPDVPPEPRASLSPSSPRVRVGPDDEDDEAAGNVQPTPKYREYHRLIDPTSHAGNVLEVPESARRVLQLHGMHRLWLITGSCVTPASRRSPQSPWRAP